jgi:hypothetical protein
MPPTIERYRVLPLQVQVFGLALCWTLTIVAISIPNWIPRVASVFTGCLAIAFLFFMEVRIDFERGVITEVGRLFGVLTVWQRLRKKEEFAGIRCYCSHAEDSESAAEWIVALHPQSGRTIYIRQYFGPRGSADCPEARAFARELSRLTGLKVIDDGV